jgi:hypothetical protein
MVAVQLSMHIVNMPAQKYTAKKNIQWRRREFVPNLVAYHEPAH